MFFFGSTSISSQELKHSYGPCMRCNGTVNLVNETRQFYVFCCLPVRPTSEHMVVCPQCGMRIRASYYYPSKNTASTPYVDHDDERKGKEGSIAVAAHFPEDKDENHPLSVQGKLIS